MDSSYIKKQQEQHQKKQQEEEFRQQAMLSLLKPEAIERLSRVRMVNPDLAVRVENELIGKARSGRLTNPLTDEELRRVLEEKSDANRSTVTFIRR
eukprot:TRINITY_DN1918_c0_g1_i1.p1 TRINITY_DN1918_c0_g1~~TRINITY_DN1918_c0_g1_i1.p1  ORF type:complete len:96 (+),score=32.55 TRINITY_DN1918_c0_g1_i1:43-330(+)